MATSSSSGIRTITAGWQPRTTLVQTSRVPIPNLHRGLADCRRHGQLLPLRVPAAWLPRLPEVGAYAQRLLPDPKQLRPHPRLQGVNVCGYDANNMLKGSSKATQVCILDNSNGTLFDDSMLPADDDSVMGREQSEVLLGAIDNFFPGDTHVYEYVFRVNFGTLRSQPSPGSTEACQSVCPRSIWRSVLSPFLTTDCVPQPSTGSGCWTRSVIG